LRNLRNMMEEMAKKTKQPPRPPERHSTLLVPPKVAVKQRGVPPGAGGVRVRWKEEVEEEYHGVVSAVLAALPGSKVSVGPIVERTPRPPMPVCRWVRCGSGRYAPWRDALGDVCGQCERGCRAAEFAIQCHEAGIREI